MRVLLDECLPKRLKRQLVGHHVSTVPEAGWAGKKNGDLIRLAAGQFDAFITIDRNMVYQQDLKTLTFGVVVLSASSNRMADIEPLVPRILEVLSSLSPTQIVRVGG